MFLFLVFSPSSVLVLQMYSCYLTWLQVWLPPWHFFFFFILLRWVCKMLLNTAAELSHLPINIHGNRQPSSWPCHLKSVGYLCMFRLGFHTVAFSARQYVSYVDNQCMCARSGRLSNVHISWIVVLGTWLLGYVTLKIWGKIRCKSVAFTADWLRILYFYNFMCERTQSGLENSLLGKVDSWGSLTNAWNW